MPDPTGPPSHPGPRRLGRIRVALALGLVTALVTLAAAAPAAARQPGNAYRQTNLVSDLPGLAQLTDPDLVNPWGLAAGPTTPAWVANNGTDTATLYPGFVNGSPIQKAGLVVNIPGGAPTGQVFNPTTGFVVRSGDASGPARFIFDSEAGLVSGWSPGVPPPPPSTQAQVGASVPDAIYARQDSPALSFPATPESTRGNANRSASGSTNSDSHRAARHQDLGAPDLRDRQRSRSAGVQPAERARSRHR